MITGLARFFSTQGFMPHGMCILWTPSVLWTMVIANALVFISYIMIPVALIYVYVKRREFQYIWVFLLFGAFIVLCGLTHLNTIITFWQPIYGIQALIDLTTGIVSFITAIVLWFLVPRLLNIPTEKELKQQNEKLRQALKELNKSNENLEQFAYIASHDLKEPLRGICNFSNILQKDYHDKLDNMANYELETIQKLSVKMTHLIDGLHKYARASQVPLTTEVTDVKKVIEDKVLLLESYLKTKNAVINISNNLPVISCNPVALGEIIYNLIHNAVKYNDSKNPKVEIIYYNRSDKHVFCIEDNGIGFNKEDIKKSFYIFRRLENSHKYGDGMGIGLNIVERMLSKISGDIWFESQKGKGTRIYFSIRKENDQPPKSS